MAKRLTKLTATQHEILEAVWSQTAGATVTEIWERIGTRRKVTRTTILNLVDRLEKRGWLKRHKEGTGFRYQATVDREATARHVASEFVEEFFGGSVSQLMLSLLGGKRKDSAEIADLRKLLDDAHRQQARK